MNFQVVRSIPPRIEVNNIMALNTASQIKFDLPDFSFGLLPIKLNANWEIKIIDQTIQRTGSPGKLIKRTWSPNIVLFDLKNP
jgi:hypothetical protein